MKFQLKALVAALAIVAAVPAQAAMQTAVTGRDSSLILTLVDSSNVVSATFDLGPTLSTFNRTLNQSWDLTSLNYVAAWNAFKGAASADKQWGVYAADGFGTAAGAMQRLATSASGALTGLSNSSLEGTSGLFDQFITASNNIVANGTTILNNHQSVADGSNFVSLIESTNAAFGGSGNAYGATGKISNLSSDANGAFDTDLFLWSITRSSTNGINQATVAQVPKTVGAALNPYFSLSSAGVLTYTAAAAAAPIPEPETYGMLLAGLGMIGFVARRRKSA